LENGRRISTFLTIKATDGVKRRNWGKIENKQQINKWEWGQKKY
jgi:hypothetical protein